MRIAFCLNYFFPYGGLQRDFIQIAERARDFGHAVDVYAIEWQGDFLPGIKIHLLPTKSWTNHGRCLKFTKQLLPILKKKKYDCVVGFNKIPHLDIYYAADPCFKAKHKNISWFKKLMPRYQYYERLERLVFSESEKTKILYLSKGQKALFQRCYQTQEERFHALTPPINPNRKPGVHDYESSQFIRKQYVKDRHILLLAVASAFKTKGIDRILHAMSVLPKEGLANIQLIVAGEDDPASYHKLASRLGLDEHVDFLGAVDAIVPLYLAADLFVHPARVENTGTVLLEAMLSGLPVLTTENCGYAEYVQEADAGLVLPDPFEQEAFNQALSMLLFSDQAKLKQYGENGKQYADSADFFSMPNKALQVIENAAKKT